MVAASSIGSSFGPSPATNVTFLPSACGTTRISENRIAASKPNRLIGCSVAFGGECGGKTQIEHAAGFFPNCPVFRKVAAGLAHQPDRRNCLTPAMQHFQQRLVHSNADHALLSITDSRFLTVVTLTLLIRLHAFRFTLAFTYPHIPALPAGVQAGLRQPACMREFVRRAGPASTARSLLVRLSESAAQR